MSALNDTIFVQLNKQEYRIINIFMCKSIIAPKRLASASAKYKAGKIKSLLDNSVDSIPTLSLLEKKFCLSKSYLQAGFQELFGSTIGHYAKELKLNQIKKLLKDHTLTLDTIAIKTGYNGGEALCRFFKMMEGVSPGVWRRKHLEIEECPTIFEHRDLIKTE
jgi:AraC-like DNA-binding protein